MSEETSVLCPVQPHELDKHLLRGMKDICQRVVASAAVENLGKDLMLRVYLAGIYHGVELSKRRPA